MPFQEQYFQETKARLAKHADKIRVLRMLTKEAAAQIQEPLDFVYVDARHDFCGAAEDIGLYWPKIRSGGLMAGHDYLTAHEVCGRDACLAMC